MSHTYASLAQFNDELRDAGSTTFASESALISARKLSKLESSSREIEGFCNRTMFRSGFGPRTGTNRYDGSGGLVLDLEDDLLTVTTLTIKAALGASGTTYTAETDYIIEPYDSAPGRRIIGRGTTGSVVFPWGLRTVEIAGTWGYSNTKVVATATTNEALDTSETAVDVSAATEFSLGQTLLVDSEQMYVRSIATNTLTVERGANGTTAANHLTAAPISIYTYPADVQNACLALAMRRWKARDAGADGTDGGGGEMPAVRPISEKAMMWQYLRHYRYELVA